MASLTRTDIQMQVNDCKKSPRICEQLVTMIKQICDAAIDDGIINTNPCRKIDIPRKKPTEKRALTAEESEAIKTATLPPLEKALLMTLYGTGMRPAEAYALTWEDVNFKEHTITVNKALQFANSKTASVGLPKTDGSVRTIPIPKLTESALKDFYNKGGKSNRLTIFGGLNGQLRSRSAYKHLFDVCMREAFHLQTVKDKVPITAYSLRHNFCTIALINGIDVKTVQYLMGHNTSKMVMEVYAHIQSTENIKDKIKSLPL